MAEHMLEQQSCAEPEGGIVQTYDSADVVATSSIVPGTEFSPAQKTAGEKLYRENQSHIGGSSQNKGAFSHQFKQRMKKRRTAVDGKHPQGCGACETQVAAAQRAHGGEDDFEAPAGETAAQKIADEIVNGIVYGGFVSAHSKYSNLTLYDGSMDRFPIIIHILNAAHGGQCMCECRM